MSFVSMQYLQKSHMRPSSIRGTVGTAYVHLGAGRAYAPRASPSACFK